MDPRTRSDGTKNVDARKQLAAWLRAGRDRRNLTIEDVAKVTKIQPRILEKLESGSFDGLPAAVFVKGFVRSFAKCVGLDESEALQKYTAAQAQPSISVTLADTISCPIVVEREAPVEAAPVEAAPVAPVPASGPVIEAPVVEAPVEVAVAPVIEPAAAVAAEAREGKRKRSRRNSKQRGKKRKQAQLAAAGATANAAQTIDAPMIAQQAIDTAPVAKSDGESLEATAIEAKTNDALDVPRSPTEDGAVERSLLAEGSDRISQTTIAVEPIEVAASTASDVIASDATASDAMAAASDAIASDAMATASDAIASDAMATASDAIASDATDVIASDSVGSEANESTESTESGGTWQPTMPPIPTTASVPWRRPNLPASTATAYVVPTLVIDDADPDSADREREDRIAKEPTRLSFLPPILLDREDRSARQGGLTLAVIILLIAATLTLSYLMRRPSPTGDGVTMMDGSSMLVG